MSVIKKATAGIVLLLLFIAVLTGCRAAISTPTSRSGGPTGNTRSTELNATGETAFTEPDEQTASVAPSSEGSVTSTPSGETTPDECPHVFTDRVVPPDCVNGGYTEHTCSLCAYTYVDELLPALGHEYLTETTQPTCTAPGFTKTVCTRCGAESISHETEPLGHDYTDKVFAPTCTEQGYTVHTCARCQDSFSNDFTEPKGHTFIEIGILSPTCEKGGYTLYRCADCGEEYESLQTEKTGHSFGDWQLKQKATCSMEGVRERTCLACGFTETEKIDKTAHKLVKDPNRLPTSYKAGITAGLHCTVCGETVREQQPIPARGTGWILEDKAFKLLLIGNSFSQDASNCGNGMKESQLLSILQAMLGKDVKIVIGICQCGNRSMTWHATQVYRGTKKYTFHVISTDAPTWKYFGETDSKTALTYTNWDFVSLQPFMDESITGVGVPKYPDEEDPRFYPLAESSAYMLDWVNLHAPQADVYCYMHWSTTSDNVLNAALSGYNKKAKFFPTVLTYRGTGSGKVYADIVPVALTIQNARTTYFATLKYKNGSVTENLSTDAQSGLLRDGWHLTFNIGRYLAALTFAETLVPASLRVKNYTLPAIRRSEAIGTLPAEYTLLAQKCVEATMKAFNGTSNRLKVLGVEGYGTDPADLAKENLSGKTLTVVCSAGATDLTAALKSEILRFLPDDFVVTSAVIPDGASVFDGMARECTVTIRFGYSSRTLAVKVVFSRQE